MHVNLGSIRRPVIHHVNGVSDHANRFNRGIDLHFDKLGFLLDRKVCVTDNFRIMGVYIAGSVEIR